MTLTTSARESGVTKELRGYEGAQHRFPFSGGYTVGKGLAGWSEALA
ncbi:hypothetical protein ACIA2T_34195 [Amycolatopsis japonica]